MGDKRKKRASRRTTSFVMPYSISKCRDRLHEGVREIELAEVAVKTSNTIRVSVEFVPKTRDLINFTIIRKYETRSGDARSFPIITGSLESLVDKSTEVRFRIGDLGAWIWTSAFFIMGLLVLVFSSDLICCGPFGILFLGIGLCIYGNALTEHFRFKVLMFKIFRVQVYLKEPSLARYTNLVGGLGIAACLLAFLTIFILGISGIFSPKPTASLFQAVPGGIALLLLLVWMTQARENTPK